jgi:hypothetical protein
MPFSFSNIPGSAILVMVICLTIAQVVKHLKKQLR